MDEEGFWTVIGLLDWEHEGDDRAVTRPAIDALKAKPVEEIVAFKELMARKLYALDTREHARWCFMGEADPDDGDAYISADWFLYRRCMVVANGRALYERVLADPSQFPEELEFEALLSLPYTAHVEKVGEEIPGLTTVSYESFSNLEGWRPNANTRPGRATGDWIPKFNRRPT